jgi:hypothetical protein
MSSINLVPNCVAPALAVDATNGRNYHGSNYHGRNYHGRNYHGRNYHGRNGHTRSRIVCRNFPDCRFGNNCKFVHDLTCVVVTTVSVTTDLVGPVRSVRARLAHRVDVDDIVLNPVLNPITPAIKTDHIFKDWTDEDVQANNDLCEEFSKHFEKHDISLEKGFFLHKPINELIDPRYPSDGSTTYSYYPFDKLEKGRYYETFYRKNYMYYYSKTGRHMVIYFERDWSNNSDVCMYNGFELLDPESFIKNTMMEIGNPERSNSSYYLNGHGFTGFTFNAENIMDVQWNKNFFEEFAKSCKLYTIRFHIDKLSDSSSVSFEELVKGCYYHLDRNQSKFYYFTLTGRHILIYKNCDNVWYGNELINPESFLKDRPMILGKAFNENTVFT